MNDTLESGSEKKGMFVPVEEIKEEIEKLKKRRRGLRKFLLDEPVNFRAYYEVLLYEIKIKIDTLESLLKKKQ